MSWWGKKRKHPYLHNNQKIGKTAIIFNMLFYIPWFQNIGSLYNLILSKKWKSNLVPFWRRWSSVHECTVLHHEESVVIQGVGKMQLLARPSNKNRLSVLKLNFTASESPWIFTPSGFAWSLFHLFKKLLLP